MLRFEVSEVGSEPLPAIDLDDAVIVIGSAVTARIRLPAQAARADHVRIEGGRWRTAEGNGEIGEAATFEIGNYRVRVAAAPPGTSATPPQRTESLARELMRSLLGGAPSLEIERGPAVGAKRLLAPPESTLVIGRGEESGWAILDEDLSKTHAEVRRGWDGSRVVDLGSKNGTKVDGATVGDAGAELGDGALIELGNVRMRYRDPAHPRATPVAAPIVAPQPSPLPFYIAVAIFVLAVGSIAWLIVS